MAAGDYIVLAGADKLPIRIISISDDYGLALVVVDMARTLLKGKEGAVILATMVDKWDTNEPENNN